MSRLSDSCYATIEYKSRGYVDDAITYARWILRLKASSPEERERMLRELDGDVSSATREPEDDREHPAQ